MMDEIVAEGHVCGFPDFLFPAVIRDLVSLEDRVIGAWIAATGWPVARGVQLWWM